jgi:shikimate kinase
MAAGKTTVGPPLAARVHRSFLDLDDLIVADAGQTVAAIFEARGEPAFRELEREHLRQALDLPSPVVLATGGGVIEDPWNRELLRRGSLVLWMDVRLETIRERIAAQKEAERPLVTRLGLSGLDRLLARRRALYAEAAHFRFDCDSQTPRALARTMAVAVRNFPAGEPS